MYKEGERCLIEKLEHYYDLLEDVKLRINDIEINIRHDINNLETLGKQYSKDVIHHIEKYKQILPVITNALNK